jgi:tetratricopeptide (TPR) repeat protein
MGVQARGISEPCAGSEPELQTADRAIQAGHWADSERLLLGLQKSYAQCVDVVLGLARLRAAQKDEATAERLFFEAIRLSPQDARAHFYFAQFCFSRDEYNRAEYYSEKAVSLDPNYPDALTLSGRILAMKRATEPAQTLLEKACKLDPQNPEAHFHLGALLDQKQLHREAVEQFEKVVSLDPRNPRAYDYLALNWEALGEAKKAEEAYQKGIQVNRGPLFDSFLDYNYGRFLLKLDRLKESESHLAQAVLLAPQTRGVYYEHAKLKLRFHKYQEAQRDAERALSLPDTTGHVQDLQVYYLLTTIYSRLGNTELAQKYADLCRTVRVPIQTLAR